MSQLQGLRLVCFRGQSELFPLVCRLTHLQHLSIDRVNLGDDSNNRAAVDIPSVQGLSNPQSLEPYPSTVQGPTPESHLLFPSTSKPLLENFSGSLKAAEAIIPGRPVHEIHILLRPKDWRLITDDGLQTLYDYTKSQLPDLIDVIFEEKASLFVCAVGVSPKDAVDKLHSAGIPVTNMVGHPTHVAKALEVGVDLICAQGSEGGGHTGYIPISLLIPACLDPVKGKKNPLTGGPVTVIAAGGIFDGRGLAAALVDGAVGVWVGTRFVASEEANAPKAHKQAVVTASLDDDIRTLIYTGRPLRVRKIPYIVDWEENRQAEMKQYPAQDLLPIDRDMEKHPESP